MTGAADSVIFLGPDNAGRDVAPGEAVLALPSRMCFSARIPKPDDAPPSGRGRSWRRTLLFDLEEKLPLTAEEVTADFLLQEDQSLGICVRTVEVAPVIDALDQAGCAVAVICPAALLALQTALEDEAAREAQVVLIGEDEHLNLFVLQDGQPRSWHLLPRAAGDVPARLSLLMPDVAQPTLCAIGLDADDVRQLQAARLSVRVPVSETLTDLQAAATAAGRDILASRRRPLVNLRRDALAPADPLRKVRRPLQMTIAAAALLMVALIGAWSIAAQRYEAVAADLHAQQAKLYRELMPEASRVPPNIPRRLASEHRAMLNRAATGGGLPTAGSALTLMRDTFHRLPGDVPLQIERVRLDDGGVELTGQVRSHQDAGRLVDALGADGLLRVQPARTQALRDRGVGFTITAQAASQMVAAGPGGGR